MVYPGELDRARAEGLSTEHLIIIDGDYHGGQKVACSASNTASCDNGYKPLDCQSYPFFPAPPRHGDVDLLVKGEKCPLQVEHLAAHAATVQDAWNDLIELDPTIREWLNRVELIGYTEPLHRFDVSELPLSEIAA